MQKRVYSRALYVSKIKPFIGKNITKVLIGHRRVGKSYILFQLINEIKKNEPKANIIYISKEDVAFDNICDYHDLDKYLATVSVKNKMNYIFIFQSR